MNRLGYGIGSKLLATSAIRPRHRLLTTNTFLSQFTQKSKEYQQVLKKNSTAVNNVLIWLIVGSLAMEMKWQRRDIAELERTLEVEPVKLYIPPQDIAMEPTTDIGLY